MSVLINLMSYILVLAAVAATIAVLVCAYIGYVIVSAAFKARSEEKKFERNRGYHGR